MGKTWATTGDPKREHFHKRSVCVFGNTGSSCDCAVGLKAKTRLRFIFMILNRK